MTAPALVARARGLALHLLDDDQLADIERSSDRGMLVSALARAGFHAGSLGGGDPRAIEDALRDRERGVREVVDRWAEEDAASVAVLDADEDRHTLRNLIRGVIAGAPSALRRAGAVATASLPAEVLDALVAAGTPGELAEALERAGHPAAAVLAPLLAEPPIDLLAIELALARWFAERAHARGGDHALSLYVAERIDVDNLVAALLLALRGRELDAGHHFLDGGTRLDRVRFGVAASASATAAAATLAPAFTDTPLAEALAVDIAVTPDAIERAALRWHLITQGRLRRSEPLGLASLVWLVLRRRLERQRVRRAAWRVAMRGSA